MPCCTEKYKLSHIHNFMHERFFIDCSQRQPTLPLSIRINTGSFYAIYEGKSISKLQIVIEKRRTGIMTYNQHLFFNVISKQV